MGLDALNPLEVKAGMNPIGAEAPVRPKDLVLHGGINAVGSGISRRRSERRC